MNIFSKRINLADVCLLMVLSFILGCVVKDDDLAPTMWAVGLLIVLFFVRIWMIPKFMKLMTLKNQIKEA